MTYSPAKVVRDLVQLSPIKVISEEQYHEIFQAKCHDRLEQLNTFPIDKEEQCLVLHSIAEAVGDEMNAKYRVKEQL